MSKNILITGASGEIGTALINSLSDHSIVGLDLSDLHKSSSKKVMNFYKGSLVNKELISNIFSKYKFDEVYHLAALLSSKCEKEPELAHDVNVNSTVNLLTHCKIQGDGIKFFFPSSIAVYGMPDKSVGNINSVLETEFLDPVTIYGCTKLYCEMIGKYYAKVFGVDFRSIRFPGIISALTLPTGGTSDYIPEMFHSAVNNRRYVSFVNESSQLPFMTMPEAVDAIDKLMQAPDDKILSRIYNIRSFSLSALRCKEKILSYFPKANIQFSSNSERQWLVDSWPNDVNDDLAKEEWGWASTYTIDSAIEQYLIPNLKKNYQEN
ncbi:MAG: hypothetical protein CBD58_01335 [bacterium TMED198]|nr:MAG: hypothetical protein CBD58_01335 [bacterium TMED198]|tara:strand:+ start:1190 stop:2155 length:966 start_codon:yes stop_codon:yes gene_type:complete